MTETWGDRAVDNTLFRLWAIEGDKGLESRFEYQGSQVQGWRVLPGGRLLVVERVKDAVQVRDAAHRTPVGPPLPHYHAAPVALSANGKLLLTCPDPEKESALPGGNPPAGDEDSLATEAKFYAQAWEIASGKPIGGRLPAAGPFWAAAFSPDGTRALTAWSNYEPGDDLRNVAVEGQLWELPSGKPIGGVLTQPPAANKYSMPASVPMAKRRCWPIRSA